MNVTATTTIAIEISKDEALMLLELLEAQHVLPSKLIQLGEALTKEVKG